MCDVDGRELTYDEADLLGDPTRPFRFTEQWNLPEENGQPSHSELGAQALRKVGIDVPEPTGRVVGRNPFSGGKPVMETLGYLVGTLYYSSTLMDGAIPVGDDGCGSVTWLVVSGEERGHLWQDRRADSSGITPLSALNEPRITFRRWYELWVAQALEQFSRPC